MGTNRYAYAGGDPVNGSDPGGNDAGFPINPADWDPATNPAQFSGLSYSRQIGNATSAGLILTETALYELSPLSAIKQGIDAYNAGSVIGVGIAVASVTPWGKLFKLGKFAGVADEVVPKASGTSVWSLPPVKRGRAIEDHLGANIGGNYPVIDAFNFGTGHATSIKSLDLGAKTYQNSFTLENRLRSQVDKLAVFDGKDFGGFNTTVRITSRQLTVAIPPGASPAQAAAIEAAKAYGATKGVDLTTKVLK